MSEKVNMRVAKFKSYIEKVSGEFTLDEYIAFCEEMEDEFSSRKEAAESDKLNTPDEPALD